MKFLSCSSKHFQFPFLLSLCLYLESLIKRYFFNNKPKSNLLFPILSSFSLLFFIFPENIYVYLNPNKKVDQREDIGKLSFHRFTKIKSSQLERSKKLKQALILLLLGLLTGLIHSISFRFILLNSFGNVTTLPLFCLFVTWVFIYLAFKHPLFKHHITALVIMVVNISSYYIHSFDTINENIDLLFNNWSFFWGLLSLNVLGISLREVIEKYLMEIHFISLTLILLVEGFISLILYALFVLIVQITPCSETPRFFNDLCLNGKWEFLKEDIVLLFNYSSIDTLYVWGLVLLSFAINYFRILTNKKLTPTHRYVAEISLLFYFFIYQSISDLIFSIPYYTKYILYAIDSVILCFACCIYNEVIIIYLFNFHVNTHKEIETRALRETFAMKRILPNEVNDVYSIELMDS